MLKESFFIQMKNNIHGRGSAAYTYLILQYALTGQINKAHIFTKCLVSKLCALYFSK